MMTEHHAFYDGLENQYDEAIETGMLDILKILEIDEEHSEPELTKAVLTYQKNDGNVTQGFPMKFMTDFEKTQVNRNGKFRYKLYTMILSAHFSDAMENKKIFLAHSLKHRYEPNT